MSNQEKVLNALDKVKLSGVDFKAYMASRSEGETNVRSPVEYHEELRDRVSGVFAATGDTLPWEYTHDKFRLRKGEVTLWMGFNGSRKSMVTGYVATYLMSQGRKPCIASFEMKPAATLARMASQAIGTHCGSVQQANRFLDWADGKMWIYDHQGMVKIPVLMGVIYYAAEQLGVDHFFIDSLMKCVRGEDDNNAQKDFVDGLCAAAKDTNIHIHLIHHSKKKINELERPGKMDAKGSGAIVDQVDNAVVVFKIPAEVKQKLRSTGEPVPDNSLHIDKQRDGAWEGQVMTYLEPDSLQFLSSKGEKARSFLI